MKSFTQAARKKTVAAACIIAFAGVGLLDPAHATFPGENGVIVFSAGGAVQKTGATGGTPTVLAENAHAPAVSPNGKWVAYVDSASRNIWVRNVDGTGAIVNVTGNLPPSNPERLTWSPDGQRLAYVNPEFMATRHPHDQLVRCGVIRGLTAPRAWTCWTSPGHRLETSLRSTRCVRACGP